MNINYSLYSYIWVPKKVYYNNHRQYFQCMAQYGIYVLCISTFITLLLLSPNPRTQSPKQQFIKYWTRPAGIKTSYHKIIPSEIKVVNNEAYDYGYYEGKTKRANGSESFWKGKYVIVWKRVNQEWKIYLDIWSALK